MNTALRLLLVLGTGALVAGCVVHSKEEIASVRASGVSARTLRKLEHRGVLTPENIIDLKNHRVDDDVVIHHLETIGVDYVPQKDDIRSMRSAGVGQPVITAVVRAGNRFVSYASAPSPYYQSYGFWGDPLYSPYYPRAYYDPWFPYGDVGLTYGRRYRYR